MDAQTVQIAEKIGSLSACAISLLQRGNRCKHQTQPVFDALARFTGEKKVAIEHEKRKHPGQFGNRCSACGGFIDDGGTCNCQTDHWTKTPGPHVKPILVEMSHQEQVTTLITLTGKAIELVKQGEKKEPEMNALLNQLQAYKDGQRVN